MADPLRHRQTKGAATDMVDLTPPRHIPTLPGYRLHIRGLQRLAHRLRLRLERRQHVGRHQRACRQAEGGRIELRSPDIDNVPEALAEPRRTLCRLPALGIDWLIVPR